MGAPRKWPAEDDALIIRRRAEGQSWDDIAAALKIARYTAIRRGQQLGLKRTPPAPVAAPQVPDRGLLPLPPGHPASWRDCLGMHEPYPEYPR